MKTTAKNLMLLALMLWGGQFFLSPALTAQEAQEANKAGEDSGDKAAESAEAGGDAKSGKDANDGVSRPDWDGRVVIIPVKGVIGPEAAGGMEEAILKAIADGAGSRLLVLEIDSPGGLVDSCDRICEAILKSPVPVYSLVTRRAVSGGAMLATATEKIYMMTGSRIGDIQPMAMLGASGMDDRTAEKIEADVRAIMTSNALHNGYSKALLEAMVSRSYQIYEVNFTDGGREFLKQPEFDLLQKHMREGLDKREFAKPPKVVVEEGKLLSLSASEAVEYGLAQAVVAGHEEFYKLAGIDAAEVVRAEIGEGEFDPLRLIKDFSLSRWVILLLIVSLAVGIAGSFAEASMPGFGIPGAVGIIGFATFFIVLFSYERAQPFEIILFVVGVALLVVEVVVLPGFGVAGVMGLVCIFAGLGLALLPELSTDYMKQNFWNEVFFASGVTLGVFLASTVLLLFILERGAKLPFLKVFFLDDKLPDGRAVIDEARSNPVIDEGYNPDLHRKFLNSCGVAVTTLRPAGKVRLDSGEVLDVVSTGELLDKGARVRVVSVEMNRIMVDLI